MNPRRPQKTIHPWWAAHFFHPLMWLQETGETLGAQRLRNAKAWLARQFALHLRDCPDHASARALIEQDLRGAEHFFGLAALEANDLAFGNLPPNTGLAPQPGKPFAALAARVIAVIDKKRTAGPGALGESSNN
jgi:hypothetical protein